MLPGFGGSFGPKYATKKAAISQQNKLFVAEMGENLEMGETTKCHEIDKISRLLSGSTMANLGGGGKTNMYT